MIGVARKEFMFTINIPFECSSFSSKHLSVHIQSITNSNNNKFSRFQCCAQSFKFIATAIFSARENARKEMREIKTPNFFFNFFYCWDYSFICSMFKKCGFIYAILVCSLNLQIIQITVEARWFWFQCKCKCAYLGNCQN